MSMLSIKESVKLSIVLLFISVIVLPVYGEDEIPEVDHTYAADVPDYEDVPDFSKTKLTGDWGGLRTDLVNDGIRLDIDILQSYQGVLDGGLDSKWKYGGSLDFWLNLDFEKMGLWPGAFVEIRAETQFGEFVNISTGTFLGTNADGLFPLPDEHKTTLSHVVYTQFLSENFGIFFGKIDTLDGDNNVFAGSRGKENFMNPNFTFNPVTLTTAPYSALGGGMVILSPVENSADPASLQFAVLGANGQPNTAGWDDDFEDGANYAVEYSQPTQFFNLSGNQLFGGTYNNKDFSLLNQDPQRFLEWLLGLGPLDQQEGSWSAYYNFHQYLFVEEDDPSQGVGIFGRYGIADDETSLVADFYSIGIGGKGIVENRDQDRFGVGYYRTNISDELPNIISSLVGDEDGIEMFYNIEVNPWYHVTVDLQYINPANQQVSDTYVAGIRMKIDI